MNLSAHSGGSGIRFAGIGKKSAVCEFRFPHTGEYEVFFFHEGEVTLNDNGTERKMHPGDFAICYDGESHGIANRTDKPASLFAAIIKTK